MRLVENALPSVFCGQLHRYSKTEGIFTWARDVTGGVWKCQSGLDKTGRMGKVGKDGTKATSSKKIISPDVPDCLILPVLTPSLSPG
jgi:hypothetical protein